MIVRAKHTCSKERWASLRIGMEHHSCRAVVCLRGCGKRQSQQAALQHRHHVHHVDAS